jgi:predicted nucleotidyltransferase
MVIAGDRQMTTPVQSREQVLARLHDAKKGLAALGVTGIGLFGSFTTGKQSASSDIDFLVEFAPDHHTFDNFMELSFLLEGLMGRPVEIVTPESLSPHMGPHILREVERVSLTG